MARKKTENTVAEDFAPSDTHERALQLTMGQSAPAEVADEPTEAAPAEADNNPKDGSDGEE